MLDHEAPSVVRLLRHRWDEIRVAYVTSMRRPAQITQLASAAIVVATLLSVAIATRPMFGKLPVAVADSWAWSVDQTFGGAWWRAMTATALTRDVFMLGSLVASTALAMVLLQGLLSGRAVLLTWFAGAVWGYLGSALLVGLLSDLGWSVALHARATVDYGPSAGTAAVTAVLVARIGVRTLTVLVVAAVLLGAAVHHQIADVEHLIAFGTAFGIARATMGLRRGALADA